MSVPKEEAVAAAAEAMNEELGYEYPPGDRRLAELIEVALEAAAPFIRADERQNIKAERILSAVFVARAADCPQPFGLYRHQDVTGVSGQGTVAYGTQFADGKVVIRWLGERPSTVVWDSLDDAMAVHGHDGRTQVVWLAAPFSEMAEAEREAVAAERARAAGEGS